MNDDLLLRMARELAVEFSLPPGESELILEQARRVRDVVATLRQLPLDGAEPSGIFQVRPETSERASRG